MKKLLKIASCVLFCAIVAFLVAQLTEVLMPKSQNRYYILEEYLKDHPEQNMHDVQVFGSCHSYTSFNPMYLEERTGVSGFVYGNAGEIIPTTYARMAAQFKKYTPKVAVVEIWGINPYKTYSSHPRVFGFYLANNLERVGLSREKIEVTNDFAHMTYSDISHVSMNLPIVTYKERLVDGSLTDVDFNYSFEATQPHSTKYMFSEMTSRLMYNGFKKNGHKAIELYPSKQNYVKEGAFQKIEADIVKYIQKIIDLCRENNVELIFYRSPYTSKTAELRKLNHMHQICRENGVLFIDTEAEIQFNYRTDFLDYEHLSEIGANKATELLIPYIVEGLEERGVATTYTGSVLAPNLLRNSDLTAPVNTAGQTGYKGKGTCVDDWQTNYSTDTITLTPYGIRNDTQSLSKGWHLHQVLEDAQPLVGKTLTAVFNVEDFSSPYIRPVISCRDLNGEEIASASVNMAKGKLTVTCVVPEETDSIRVGLFAYKGIAANQYVTLRSVTLHEGAYSLETLPRTLAGNLLSAAQEDWRTNFTGDTLAMTEAGLRNDTRSTGSGWHMHQVVEAATLPAGQPMTAVFEVEDFTTRYIRPAVSFRDGEDNELLCFSGYMANGTVTVPCTVPEGTRSIRVGFYAYEGVEADQHITLRSAALYKGTYTAETLPEAAPGSLLLNGDLTSPQNASGLTAYTGGGACVDHWQTNFTGDTITLTPDGIRNDNQSTGEGWHLHQLLENAAPLVGRTLTAVFDVEAFSGQYIRPVISCRDENDREIASAAAMMAEGRRTFTIVVPEGTAAIRVGLFAYDGVKPGDTVTLRSAGLYEGSAHPDARPDACSGNLLLNSNLTSPRNTSGLTGFTGGQCVDGWRTNFTGDVLLLTAKGIKTVNSSTGDGWHLHQVLENAAPLEGRTLTAVFDVEAFSGQHIRPVISCRDENDREIASAAAVMAEGERMVTCAVPEGTRFIRVGLFAYDGVQSGDTVTLRSVSLYDGNYEPDTYPGKRSGNLLLNSDLTAPHNAAGKHLYLGKDACVDDWRTNFSGDLTVLTPLGLKNVTGSTTKGWHLHQVLENAAPLEGSTLTAVFHVEDFTGSGIYPIISCRNGKDREIRAVTAELAKGMVTVTCKVPKGTEMIRVGLYAREGGAGTVTLRSVTLHEVTPKNGEAQQ